MAIQVNGGKDSLSNSRNFVIRDGHPIYFQPIESYCVVDVHKIKARQGYFLSIPCGLDVPDVEECYLCNSFPRRKSLYWRGVDHLDDYKVKTLQLPKTGARVLLEFIGEHGLEPTKAVFTVGRQKTRVSYEFQVTVTDMEPCTSIQDDLDLEETLLNWSKLEHLKKFVDVTKLTKKRAR
jgi:hypothetical protein